MDLYMEEKRRKFLLYIKIKDSLSVVLSILVFISFGLLIYGLITDITMFYTFQFPFILLYLHIMSSLNGDDFLEQMENVPFLKTNDVSRLYKDEFFYDLNHIIPIFKNKYNFKIKYIVDTPIEINNTKIFYYIKNNDIKFYYYDKVAEKDINIYITDGPEYYKSLTKTYKKDIIYPSFFPETKKLIKVY
jgi:hypothetical protein